MKAKIKEVQDYFINKILSGEFITTEVKKYTLSLLVDNTYRFEIWIANEPKSRKTYEIGGEPYFISLEFSEEQSIELDKILQPHIQEWREKVDLVEKRKQLQRLKEELGEL